ncbi:MAG: hypothetical protein Q4A00_05055 [Flavobacteriaceae bacterium]|nr:hypothetical protein [Flavobacteriaceae bacterium]
MVLSDIVKKLNNQESVYIKDDFEEVVIRLIPNNEEVIVYAKFKGKAEYLIDRKAKLVLDVEMNGKEISKSEYEEY